ncbi:MAG: radical SAM protein [Deltaproteobacteria bacterium]|nr:radical SAM protein [Deltaproteobacteria bacterium]
MNLLLCSVFGPFGVDDEYGRQGNKMELFHNQITREQGIFSYRFHHASFGLYFIAENLRTPVTVLDFPNEKEFIDEVKKGYTHVGISFILPNIKKASRMADLIREFAPESEIILGGHGTAHRDIETLIDCDHVCRGEGVAWLRKFFGEPTDTPLVHPLVNSAQDRRVMGVKLPSDSGVIIPGVGCPNKCRFCSTSHYFKNYIPFLSTGREIFNVCQRYEKEMGITDFGVLDENFMKHTERMYELLELMEKNNKFYTFSIFSSAETLVSLKDYNILSRLGIKVIWVGVESKTEIYDKNRGINLKILFAQLQKRGISILASAILFLEHHDKTTIWEDIDYAIDLKPEYLQFMELGPMPDTELYKEYKKKNILSQNVPFEEMHGQDKIWFDHPDFTREESAKWLKAAFQRDYEINGASFLRYVRTALRGYEWGVNNSDRKIRKRAENEKKSILELRYFLMASTLFSQNSSTSLLIRDIKSRYLRLFNGNDLKTRLYSFIVTLMSIKYFLFMKAGVEMPQPSMKSKKFRSDKYITSEPLCAEPEIPVVSNHPISRSA